MKIKPKHDYLLVEPLERADEETTAGGIVLPETARVKQMRGTVLEVGDGRWNSSLGKYHGFSVNPGAVVLFSEFAGIDVKVENRDLKLIRDLDVIAEFV